jgi:hypothetical protein
MHQWVYVSKCLVAEKDIEHSIEDIVEVGRSRNALLQITGALFFTGTHYAQLLEGPLGGIMALRSSILADLRHENVVTVLDGRIEHRRFAGWSLDKSPLRCRSQSTPSRSFERVREFLESCRG